MPEGLDYEKLRRDMEARRQRRASVPSLRSDAERIAAAVERARLGSSRGFTTDGFRTAPSFGSAGSGASSRIDFERLRSAAGRVDSDALVSVKETARRAKALPPMFSDDEATEDDSGGGGGLFGNLAAIKDVVASAPAGLAQLGAEAVDSTVGNLGAMVARRIPGVDAKRVREEFGPIGRAVINESTLEALDEGASTGDALFAALPLGVSLGKSFQATGGRVVDQAAALAPGGKPAGEGAYAEAYDREQLLPALIEDVGNAALLGSVAARPVAAGAARAAARTGSPRAAQVAKKASQVADLSAGIDEAVGKALLRAPLTIPNRAVGRLTGRSIGDRLVDAGTQIAGTDRYRRFRESPLVTKALDETFISPRSRALGRKIGDDRMYAAFDSEVVADALRDVVRITGEQPELGIAAMLDIAQVNRLVPDLSALDEASFTRLVGKDGALRSLGDAFDESAIRTGIQVASKYLHNRDALTPEAVAKIDGASEVWRSRVLPVLEERFLEQVGRRDEVPAGRVRLLAGDDLLPFETDRVLRELRGRFDESDPRLAAALDEAREKVTSAPAKYRTAIVFARELDTAVDEMWEATDDVHPAVLENLERIKGEIVTSTVAALDEMPNPGFLMGGRIDRDGPNLRNVRAAPATKSSAEFTKEGVLGPVAPADQALTIVRDFHRGASTESAKWLSRTMGQPAASLVPDLFKGSKKPTGRDIAKAVDGATDTPLVAWDIRPWSSDEGGNVPLDQITANTTFVPAWAVDAFDNATAKVTDAERLMRDYFDRPTRWWKGGVLAMSPTWHAGNMVGNVLMAWAGGVPPSRQIELWSEAKEMVNRAHRGEFLEGDAPRRMYGTGQSYDAANTLAFARASETGTPTRSELSVFRGPNRLQRRLMSNEVEPTTRRARARNAAAQPIRSSYGLNGFIDDLTHSIVYIDRVKKGASPEKALRDALKVAGDFTNLTKFERQWLRRPIVFWSWLKHITTLSADLAINHPLRTAWTLNLWTLAADEGTDSYSDIPFLSGSVPVGPTSFLRTNNLLPFGAAMDVAEGGATDPLGLIGGASNPFIKLAMEGATGLEFGPNGLQPLSRPFGTGPTDAYGNERFGPIGWGPFGNRVTRLLPQLRGARELMRDRDDRVVRYDTGQPVTIDGQVIPEQNRRDAGEIIARDVLRLPVFPPLEADPEAIRARRGR